MLSRFSQTQGKVVSIDSGHVTEKTRTKTFVKSDKSGYAFVYRSVLSREEFMHARVSEVADELSDGEPLPLMLAFAQHEKFTVEELNRLQKMIDELKNRTRRKKP